MTNNTSKAVFIMILLGFFNHAQAQDSSTGNQAGESEGLILPDDLIVNDGEGLAEDTYAGQSGDDSEGRTSNYALEEERVGNRLDRVTVTWDNGITEIYQNNRRDTLWAGEDNELGEVQNIRQWRIGSW